VNKSLIFVGFLVHLLDNGHFSHYFFHSMNKSIILAGFLVHLLVQQAFFTLLFHNVNKSLHIGGFPGAPSCTTSIFHQIHNTMNNIEGFLEHQHAADPVHQFCTAQPNLVTALPCLLLHLNTVLLHSPFSPIRTLFWR
jgi:hypothetical protein